LSIWVNTQDTLVKGLTEEKLIGIIREHFRLTPKGIIETLNLRRPIYKETARHGHFGRERAEFTWEKTDKAAALKKAAGI
jgi:S-adenosylmethionine synthetase